MEAISAVADIGVILPLLLAGPLLLAACGCGGAALRWAGAALITAAITGLLKVTLAETPGFTHFPSGHVSLATAFYGGLLAVLGLTGGSRVVGAGLVLLLALIEGWSRVELTEHDWGDVAGGAFLALACLLLCGFPAGFAHKVLPKARLWAVAGLAAASPVSVLTYPWLGQALRGIVP